MKIDPRSAALVLSAFLATGPGVAQTPGTKAITEDRVREVLEFLASDELAGRDTPSPGLERAMRFVVEAFQAAGLRPGVGDAEPSWFHRYELSGLEIDLDGARVVVAAGAERTELIAGADYRVWTTGRAFADQGLRLRDAGAQSADAGQRRDLAGRTVRILEVEADAPLWLAAAPPRRVLGGGRLRNAAPVLLVRRGAAPPGPDVTLDVDLPAPTAVDVPLANVVGVLPGTDLAEEYVLVTAHLDHVGIRPSDRRDTIYNGADDDGTGSTAVVVLAEHFAGAAERMRRTLVFVSFSGEEKGLRGSRAFADSPPFPLDDVAVVVNLEMLGRPERDAPPFAWVTGAGYSDFADVVGPSLRTAGVELVDFQMADQLFGASDNYPLAQKGVVAHSISAGTLHADYHRPSDEVGRIDFEHMTAVIRGLAGVVRAFADRDERPAWTEAGRKRLARRR